MICLAHSCVALSEEAVDFVDTADISTLSTRMGVVDIA